MDINEKNLKKLNRLLQAMDEDSLTRSEFTEAFKKVLDFAKQIKSKNLEEFKTINDTVKKITSQLKSDNDFNKDDLKVAINSEVKKLLQSFDVKSTEIDNRMAEVRDGKDADEKKILKKAIKETAKELKSSIPKLRDFVDGVTATFVRDLLENLRGEERLDIDAIKGLRKALEKKETSLGSKSVVASLPIRFVDDETPSGTVNGTNKDFDTNLSPSPATSLKVYVNGQRMRITEDYTLSGKTISFVIAPPTGSIILVDYRV